MTGSFIQGRNRSPSSASNVLTSSRYRRWRPRPGSTRPLAIEPDQVAPIVLQRGGLATDDHVHWRGAPARHPLTYVAHREAQRLEPRQQVVTVNSIDQGVLVMVLRRAQKDVLVATRFHKDTGVLEVGIGNLEEEISPSLQDAVDLPKGKLV